MHYSFDFCELFNRWIILHSEVLFLYFVEHFALIQYMYYKRTALVSFILKKIHGSSTLPWYDLTSQYVQVELKIFFSLIRMLSSTYYWRKFVIYCMYSEKYRTSIRKVDGFKKYFSFQGHFFSIQSHFNRLHFNTKCWGPLIFPWLGLLPNIVTCYFCEKLASMGVIQQLSGPKVT